MRFPTLPSLALGAALTVGVLAPGCTPADSSDEQEPGADAGREEVARAEAAAPGHYSVEYENDAVRLLRVSYEPGERSALHVHPAHCAVALGPSTWRMTPREGEALELAMEAGQVTCVEAGSHRMENTGTEVAEAVLVEFEPGATAGSDALPDHPDAVSADPDHYTIEHENDVARLLRIRYGPGETSVMHQHPANCAIFLHDQPTAMEMPGGEVVENDAVESGHVACGEAGAHLPTNRGEERLELILVELKGRATWAGGNE